MEVCRLPELPLAAWKDGIRPPYPTFAKVFSTKWLGLMPVNLLGFIASEANVGNGGKWELTDSGVPLQWKDQGAPHFSTLKSQQLTWEHCCYVKKEKDEDEPIPDQCGWFPSWKLICATAATNTHSPRSEAHSWQWTTYKRWLLSWH